MASIIIHAEGEGIEGVQAYQGDDFAAAKSFVDGLENISIIQCNLFKELPNHETRSLGRKGKNNPDAEEESDVHAADALLSDIKAWLSENE